MRIIERLTHSIRSAAVYNSEVQVSPACILWPDSDRQWQAVVPRLQAELPELFVLGDFDPENRTGPAIWLRCVLAGTVEDVNLQNERTPILYLPGISRQDLRAVENCADQLKPLAELQYRGVIWSQVNAKDWTITAFLKSDQGGLGLDVGQDNETKNAMQLALAHLLDEEIGLLKGKRLDQDYFNTLLTGDPMRDLLQWFNQEEAFRLGRSGNEWKAFVAICKSQLAFDPENDGILAGAARLAARTGPWRAVWERFCEAPRRYPQLPAQIRKSPMPPTDLFDNSLTRGGWPQWNEGQENNLRSDLALLSTVPPHIARQRLSELEKQHADRRQLVWAELGEAPLAIALEHLAVLAATTANGLVAGTVAELATAYENTGWRADQAAISSLAGLTKPEDVSAVTTVLRAVYLPWAEDSARYLQKVVEQSGYPGGTITSSALPVYKQGECFVFVDGLRFDAARRLADMLVTLGCQVDAKQRWSALPSVTATGKPAITPVKDKIRGQEANADFEPCVAESGQSLKGGYHLKKLLTTAGWEILDRSSYGNGQGNAWTEFGDIDHEGHDRGWKLTRHLDSVLAEIRDHVLQLLDAGWKTVRIVTDHGWLLMPGGLPKIELSSALTDNKWGRCAAIKPGAATLERLFPWYWNPNQSFALADGISCFRAGQEYAHGGLSLQECLVLELNVTHKSGGGATTAVEFTDIVWKGLRCTVAVNGQVPGLTLDVRLQPGNSSSSAVVGVKPLKDNGTASVVIEDDELEGQAATLVLLDKKGGLVAQIATIIGGGSK